MAWIASNKVLTSAKAAALDTVAKPQQRSIRAPLSMYTEMPSGEIALEEFERFALDRLKGEHREREASQHLCLKILHSLKLALTI